MGLKYWMSIPIDNTCIIMIVTLECHAMSFLLCCLACNVSQFVQFVRDVPPHFSSQNI